ncbi:MAG: sugar phosphate isomerase/epimerase [Trueperaceae bacterium]|nr:sugar phosphate isomerase/epimerase [Trueperaceae bacterium]
MKIAAFPKCYLESITEGELSVFDWIEMAKPLGAEGLEMYEGFLTSLDDPYLDELAAALKEAGFAMPMLCCSPNFTSPDAKERKAAINHEIKMVEVSRKLGGPKTVCRILTGQRYPDLSLEQGLSWVKEAIMAVLPVAREHDVVLGLENHYKDGYWHYPEFAQKKDVFLQVLASIEETEHFGVQYDPSNAIVAGDDPIELLREVLPRVVSMHASDRYLVEGAKLEDLRLSDGTLGYSPDLKHGVTGQGLNDYDAIFSLLKERQYSGWISIEDGMNGMDEMKASIDFLKSMRQKYFA